MTKEKQLSLHRQKLGLEEVEDQEVEVEVFDQEYLILKGMQMLGLRRAKQRRFRRGN